jgi:hypothetical protein
LISAKLSRKGIGTLTAALLIIAIVVVVILGASYIAYMYPGSVASTSPPNYGLPNENYSKPAPASAPSPLAYSIIYISNGASLGLRFVGFDPQNIYVVIGVNNTVVWDNLDNVIHSVVSQDANFNSGNLTLDQSWNFTFSSPGSYHFTDGMYPWMNGSVTVVS